MPPMRVMPMMTAMMTPMTQLTTVAPPKLGLKARIGN
jgi:hypothetical protein